MLVVPRLTPSLGIASVDLFSATARSSICGTGTVKSNSSTTSISVYSTSACPVVPLHWVLHTSGPKVYNGFAFARVNKRAMCVCVCACCRAFGTWTSVASQVPTLCMCMLHEGKSVPRLRERERERERERLHPEMSECECESVPLSAFPRSVSSDSMLSGCKTRRPDYYHRDHRMRAKDWRLSLRTDINHEVYSTQVQ